VGGGWYRSSVVDCRSSLVVIRSFTLGSQSSNELEAVHVVPRTMSSIPSSMDWSRRTFSSGSNSS
jgi:hypothetical protein